MPSADFSCPFIHPERSNMANHRDRSGRCSREDCRADEFAQVVFLTNGIRDPDRECHCI